MKYLEKCENLSRFHSRRVDKIKVDEQKMRLNVEVKGQK